MNNDVPKYCFQQSNKRSDQEILEDSKCIRKGNHESSGDPNMVVLCFLFFVISDMFACSYTIVDYKLEQYFSLTPNQPAVNNP